ncbi:MAG: peptidylprolyl isomerase [Dehalococcoidales bacterium]|nr:peptidylprolyl isomerase [Dehalococcoidales bacterium]
MKKSHLILVCLLAGICLFGATFLSACGSKSIAETGDTVQVHYTLTLADGTLYETSVGSEPLELVLGEGNFLPDFEEAIVGMKVGESKTITILAADAYGDHRDDLIFTLDRSQLAEGIDPKVGDHLQSTDASGQTVLVVVTAVSETTITVDANSPLAGQDLTFQINLLKIN